jgi:hypothetical protein
MKSKGKEHPFAGHLQEGETVLWVHTTKSPLPSSGYLIGGYVLLMLILVPLLISAEQMAVNHPEFRLKEFAIFIRVVILGYWIAASAYYVWFVFRPFTYAYAITNQRLLYRRLDHVQSLALIDIPQIELLSVKRSSGTLSFGKRFPQWKRIKKAPQVVKIIEKARSHSQNGAMIEQVKEKIIRES